MKENTEVAKITLNAPTGDFDVREVKIASFGEKVSVIAPDEIDENADGVNVIGSIKASRKKVSEEENAVACFLNENGEALYADVFEDANGKTIGYLQTNRKNEYIRIVKFRIIPIILIILACAAVLTGVFFALRGASVPADNPAATASVEPAKTLKPEKTEEPQKTDNHEKTQEPANTDSPQPAKTPGTTEAEGKDNTKDETYSIVYNLNGGELSEENPTSYNKKTPGFTLKNPVKNGYEFLGWRDENTGTVSDNVSISAEDKGNKNYTALWKAIEYSIAYELNEGTQIKENPTSYTIESEDFTLNAPVREGYTFKGFTGSNGDVPQADVKIEKGTTGNLSYTANWEAIEYTITIDAAGGEFAEENPASYTIESEDFTLNVPVREGYTFKGFTGSNGDVPQADVKIEKGTTGNLSYTANWEAIEYTITINAAGGEFAGENPTSYTIESEDFTLNAPVREGYTFKGFTGSNGDEPQTDVKIIKGTTGDLSYTANWELVTYSITYELNGGELTAENPAQYNFNTPDFTLNNPKKDGYVFAGWTGSNGIAPQGSVTVLQGSCGDLRYVANWEIINYSISYELDGGTGSDENPSEYNVETDTFTLKPPVKEGYTFKGFTGSNGNVPQVIVTIEKGSLGDKTYTANWVVKSYLVSYELDGGSLPEGVENPSSYTMFTEDFTLNAPTKSGYTFCTRFF